jgi:hypothetical protein
MSAIFCSPIKGPRWTVDESYKIFVSKHLGRATELQVRCRFDGANINERIFQTWNALVPLFEAKEPYDGRYKQLLEYKGTGEGVIGASFSSPT